MATELQTILKLRVPIIVQIGQREMHLDDIVALGPGAILELNASSDEELTLLVNNKAIGKGVAVKVSENFGLQVTHLDSASDRVAALGG